MTAHSMRGDGKRCLAAGMDDFLSKPLEVTAFDAALERWLGGSVGAAMPATETNGDGAAGPSPNGDREELADSGALPRLVDIFATQTPERVHELRAAIGAWQRDVIARLAHTMKGGAASIGAARLADVCRELEELAGTDFEPEAALELIDAIDVAFEAAREALEREVSAAADST